MDISILYVSGYLDTWILGYHGYLDTWIFGYFNFFSSWIMDSQNSLDIQVSGYHIPILDWLFWREPYVLTRSNFSFLMVKSWDPIVLIKYCLFEQNISGFIRKKNVIYEKKQGIWKSTLLISLVLVLNQFLINMIPPITRFFWTQNSCYPGTPCKRRRGFSSTGDLMDLIEPLKLILTSLLHPQDR